MEEIFLSQTSAFNKFQGGWCGGYGARVRYTSCFAAKQNGDMMSEAISIDLCLNPVPAICKFDELVCVHAHVCGFILKKNVSKGRYLGFPFGVLSINYFILGICLKFLNLMQVIVWKTLECSSEISQLCQS